MFVVLNQQTCIEKGRNRHILIPFELDVIDDYRHAALILKTLKLLLRSTYMNKHREKCPIASKELISCEEMQIFLIQY